MKKSTRFISLMLAVVMLMTFDMSSAGATAMPSGMKAWSPGYVDDFLQYTMNAAAYDIDDGSFVDGDVSYLVSRDTSFASEQFGAISNGRNAGVFSKMTWQPTAITDNAILTVADAPADYNIPTGSFEYAIERDYAGIPSWIRKLLNWFDWAIPAYLTVIAKSGVPKAKASHGDLHASLNHNEIDWLKPGNTKYWIQVNLQKKATNGLYVRANKGHIMSLTDSSGKKYEMTYDGTEGYRTTSSLSVGSYKLIIDGVEYPITVRGLKLQRTHSGRGVGQNWEAYYAGDEQALYVLEQHELEKAYMEQGVQLSGDWDKDWTLITLDNGWSDSS